MSDAPPPDMKAMLEQAQQMQTRLMQLQRELARRTVEASAGGGMVSAVVSGELRVLQVKIEPELLAANDREMLQDLVAAAINTALGRAQQMVQEEMQRAAGMAGVPGLQGSPGAAPGRDPNG